MNHLLILLVYVFATLLISVIGLIILISPKTYISLMERSIAFVSRGAPNLRPPFIPCPGRIAGLGIFLVGLVMLFGPLLQMNFGLSSARSGRSASKGAESPGTGYLWGLLIPFAFGLFLAVWPQAFLPKRYRREILSDKRWGRGFLVFARLVGAIFILASIASAARYAIK